MRDIGEYLCIKDQPAFFHEVAGSLRYKRDIIYNVQYDDTGTSVNDRSFIISGDKPIEQWEIDTQEFLTHFSHIRIIKELGTYLCISDKPQIDPGNDFNELLDSGPGYRKGVVYNIIFDNKFPDLGRPYIVTLPELSLSSAEESDEFYRLDERSFKTYFVSLRKAKLSKLNAICDAGPDN